MQVVFDVYFGYNKKNIVSVASVSASYFSQAHVHFPMTPTSCFTPRTELASDTLSPKQLCEQICWRMWEGHSCIKTLISSVSDYLTRWMHPRSQVLCIALQHFHVTLGMRMPKQTNTSFRFASLLCIYVVGKIQTGDLMESINF